MEGGSFTDGCKRKVRFNQETLFTGDFATNLKGAGSGNRHLFP